MFFFDEVLDRIRTGRCFPNLEDQYQLAIGNSKERAILLVLLAEQHSEASLNEEIGNVILQKTRSTAQGLGVQYIDQLLPRLVEDRYGPALVKHGDRRGVYEFADPVFRAYVKLRRLD